MDLAHCCIENSVTIVEVASWSMESMLWTILTCSTGLSMRREGKLWLRKGSFSADIARVGCLRFPGYSISRKSKNDESYKGRWIENARMANCHSATGGAAGDTIF